MDESPIPKTGMLIAFATGIAMVVAGASPWIALAAVVVWAGSLWLGRPTVGIETRPDNVLTVSRETIAPFIEPLGVPLLLLDGERIVAANKAAREALGSHIAGQDARVAMRHPDAVVLLGDDRPSSTTIAGLTGAGSLWQLSRFDIDENFRLIEFVNRTAEADISRAHTDFVANASHELRTPLSSLVGYLETLRDPDARPDDRLRERFLETMESEARRMQSLVDDLMSLSRIEAEKHDVPRERIDLCTIARSVAHGVGKVGEKPRVTIADGGAKVMIVGEPVQIEQLVRNLVDNALKYGDPATPVAVTVAEKDGKAVLQVADSGPGIAREHLPHLTRRFYRTDPARSRASGGTGLGLAICKHIVERHRGELDIASIEGKGTTVTVRLPLSAAMS